MLIPLTPNQLRTLDYLREILASLPGGATIQIVPRSRAKSIGYRLPWPNIHDHDFAAVPSPAAPEPTSPATPTRNGSPSRSCTYPANGTPAGPGAAPPVRSEAGAASGKPAGAKLCPIEQAVIDYLQAEGERRTLPQIRAAIEKSMGEPVSEGQLKTYLARLTNPAVGILDNDRAAQPQGYRLTEANGKALPRMLRSSEVAAMCGMSTRTIWRLIAKGKFPKPFGSGPKLRRWRADLVEDWIANPPTDLAELVAAEEDLAELPAEEEEAEEPSGPRPGLSLDDLAERAARRLPLCG